MDKEVAVQMTVILYKDGSFTVDQAKANDISGEMACIMSAGVLQSVAATMTISTETGSLN